MRTIPGLDQPQWWVAAQLTALVDAAQAAGRQAICCSGGNCLKTLLPTLQALATQNAHPVVAS